MKATSYFLGKRITRKEIVAIEAIQSNRCDQDRWYWCGRRYRAAGRSREFPDGRLKLESRQSFYRGWDEEDRLRRVVTPEQVAEARETLRRFKEFAANL
jgi:hypothetical protein